MAAISGIDWAAEFHDVRIADTDTGALLAERRFAHDEAGISGRLELLAEHRVEAVAIERSHGLVVGRLLAAAISVVAIHPNQVADARDRFRAAAGMAPVAIESGKRRTASFRWAYKRLRNQLAILADSTRHWHPWAHDVYQRAIERGADHPHATRILGRAWTRILWRCWQDQTAYDPTRHGNLTRLLQARG